MLGTAACFAWYRRATHNPDEMAYQAVRLGNLAAVKRLLEKHPELLTQNQKRPPHLMLIAGWRPEILSLIAPSMVKACDDKRKLWMALARFVGDGQFESARILLDCGVDPNEGATHSLLLDACRKSKDLKMAQLLLRHGADTTAALSWACDQPDSRFAFRLFERGADARVPKALANAVRNEHWELVEALIQAGANTADGLIGVRDSTPRDLVRRMVEAADVEGLDGGAQTELWRNLFTLADSSVFNSVAPRFDLPSKSSPLRPYDTPRPILELVKCAGAVDPEEKLFTLLRLGADPNAVESMTDDRTALHVIARLPTFPDDVRIAMAKILIDHGCAAVRPGDDRYWTPLRACFHGPLILMDGPNGTQYEAEDQSIERPSETQFEIAKLILQARDAREWRDDSGENHLHFLASERGNSRVAELATLAVDLGADIHQVSESGETPLHVAAGSDNAEIARFLLASGANPNVRTTVDRGRSEVENWTPLHSAASRGSLNVAEILIRAGANRSVALDDGRTPLDVASTSVRRHGISLEKAERLRRVITLLQSIPELVD